MSESFSSELLKYAQIFRGLTLDQITIMLNLADQYVVIEQKRQLNIKKGMLRAKAKGKHIGRPKGSTESSEKFWQRSKMDRLRYYLEARPDLSLRELAALIGVSVNTVRKAKAYLRDSELPVTYYNSAQEETSTTVEPGYVYVIYSSTGHYKIGYSINPDERLKSFIRGFGVKIPVELRIEHRIQTNNMRLLENALHQRFANKHINGEWFQLDENDLMYLRTLDKVDY